VKIKLIAVLLIALIGCSEDNNPTADLTGVWVDEVTSVDTLEFLKFDDGSTLMNLKRGRAIYDGVDLPKIGSGLYSYLLQDKSIALRYSFSSDSRDNDYFFDQKGKKLEIGKFFQSDNPNTILVFRKVKQ
jgi:hypothetical protein